MKYKGMYYMAETKINGSNKIKWLAHIKLPRQKNKMTVSQKMTDKKQIDWHNMK
jgi:hypothetical protein